MKIRCFLCSTEYEASSAAVPCPCCHMTHSVKESDAALCRGLYEASKQMQEKRFNKARHMYLSLCREYPDSFYPFFGLAASKYGVSIAEEDGNYVPRCLCPTDEKFTDCPSFRKACALADGITAGIASRGDTSVTLHGTEDKKALLRSLGERIESDRANVTKLASLIPSYDIFLSINYEPESKDYDRTADRLYNRLTEQGGRVFFAPEIIPEADDRQAAPFVYRALETCTQMLVYISDVSDIASFRLRNEITRYNALAAAGLKDENSIVVAYSGIKKEDIPPQLAKFPSFEVRGGGRKSEPLPTPDLEPTSEQDEAGIASEVDSDALPENVEEATDDNPTDTEAQTMQASEGALEERSDSISNEPKNKFDGIDIGSMLSNAMKKYIKNVSDSFSELSSKLSKNDVEVVSEQSGAASSQYEELQKIDEESDKACDSDAQISAESDKSEIDTQFEIQAETDVEIEAETEVEAETETETEVEVETETEAETKVEVEVEAEAEAEMKVEVEAEAETEPEIEFEAEAEADAETEFEATAEAEVEIETVIDTPAGINTTDEAEAFEERDSVALSEGNDRDIAEQANKSTDEEPVYENFDIENQSSEKEDVDPPTDDQSANISTNEEKAQAVEDDTTASKPRKSKKRKKEKVVSQQTATPGTRATKIINTLCVVILIAIIGGAITAVHLMGWLFAGTNGLEYQYKSGGYYVTDYSGNSTNVTIPKMYKGNKVVGISANAFSGSNIVSLSIASSVTDYEEGCLAGIQGLEKLSLPAPSSGIENAIDREYSDVKKSLIGYLFGSTAYSGALSVDQTTLFKTIYTAYIPATLKEITINCGRLESGALSGIKSLEKAVLSDKVSVIEPYAFRDCDRLVYADIGNGTICIGNYSFYNCTSLEKVRGGKNVYVIGSYALFGCVKLSSFEFCKKTVSIGDYAFSGCLTLEKIKLPEALESIGNYTFNGCVSIKEADIPASVTGMYEGVFCSCTSLHTFTGGENLLGFGNAFFYECAALVSITYPFAETFTSIGDNAFQGCSGITELCNSPYITSIGAYAYVQSGISGNLVISENISSIGDKAFALCSKITSVTVPATTALGTSVFAGCSGLVQATLGHDTVPNYCFSSCDALETITLTADNITLGDHCFDSCSSLKTLKGSEKISVIGKASFAYCKALETLDASNTVQINENAFENCSGLTLLILSDKLERIGDFAFSGCHGFVTLDIPASVQYVGTYCFANWTSSQTINMLYGVSTINWHTYWMELCRANVEYLRS